MAVGQSHRESFAQEGTCGCETLDDIVGPIEVGVHDEAFPTYGGAGFFKVDAHHDEDLSRALLGRARPVARHIRGRLRDRGWSRGRR